MRNILLLAPDLKLQLCGTIQYNEAT